MKTVNKANVSKLHRDKARRFGDLLEAGVIRKSVLPNHAPDFNREQRIHDKERYIKYITSSCYEEVLNGLGLPYVGD